MNSLKLTPKSHLPNVIISELSGNEINLGEKNNNNWKIIVVYRGLHCPICTNYLSTLHSLKESFDELNIEAVAVSADSLKKVQKQFEDYDPWFSIGYDLTIEQMETLGLYISLPRSPEETDRPFAEPGLFVVNDKNELQIIDISNAPFARPELKSILEGIKFISENKYPIRGTYKK